jgi:hypothetical protein
MAEEDWILHKLQSDGIYFAALPLLAGGTYFSSLDPTFHGRTQLLRGESGLPSVGPVPSVPPRQNNKGRPPLSEQP